jgi:hypothetical protein
MGGVAITAVRVFAVGLSSSGWGEGRLPQVLEGSSFRCYLHWLLLVFVVSKGGLGLLGWLVWRDRL